MYAIGSYVMLNRLVRKSTQLAVVLLNFICKVNLTFEFVFVILVVRRMRSDGWPMPMPPVYTM